MSFSSVAMGVMHGVQNKLPPTCIWHSGHRSSQCLHRLILHGHLCACDCRRPLWTFASHLSLVHATSWKRQDPKWIYSTNENSIENFCLDRSFQSFALLHNSVKLTPRPNLYYNLRERETEKDEGFITSLSLTSPVHLQPTFGHLIASERIFLSVALSGKMS